MRKRLQRVTPGDINATIEANTRGFPLLSTQVRTSAINGEMVVSHDLGLVPDGFIYNGLSTTFVLIQVTDEQRARWTDTQVVVTGNAETDVMFWVFKRV